MRAITTCLGSVALLMCVSCQMQSALSSTGVNTIPLIDLNSIDPAHADPGTDRTMEFSTNGEYVCVWWRSELHRQNEPGRLIVLDLKGRIISNAVSETNGTLASPFRTLFPRTDETTCASFKFMTNACVWTIDSNTSVGVRVVKRQRPKNELEEVWSVECWTLSPAETMLWQSNLPATISVPKVVSFFRRGLEKCVIIAFSEYTGYILSQNDGRIIGEFRYGETPLVKNLASYKKAHGFEKLSDDDPIWSFSAACLAFDPLHNLLACGPSYSRKVRVLSMIPPYEVVWEAHRDEGPITRRELWSSLRVDFQAEKFLVIESFCSKALGQRGRNVAEVYDVRTWQEVWNSGSITSGSTMHCISISPDGLKMAYLREHYIELIELSDRY